MSYTISGLPIGLFAPLFGLSDDELARRGVSRTIVDAKPGFPCRITLAEAELGERVYLLNFEHQPARTPYRSSHAIFVREDASHTATSVDRIPESLRLRLLSVRAFDAEGTMIDADVVEGAQLEQLIERFLADPGAAYLHVHNARRGCYAARVDRTASDAFVRRNECGTV
jgi:hypothetical protein